MRVGSFILMRGKNPRHYDAIVCVPRAGICIHPSRFEYERRDRPGYIEQAIQFLNQTRSPNDPAAVDILVKLWPDLSSEIDSYIQRECLKELLPDNQPTEDTDEPPTPIPF